MRAIVASAMVFQILGVSFAVQAADAPLATGCQTVQNSFCPSEQSLAAVQTVTGAVGIMRNTAVNKAKSGAALVSGDRVIAQQGFAVLSLSDQCKVTVPSFSTARITNEGLLTCVAFGTTPEVVKTNSTGNILLGGALLGAVGGAVALSNQSSPSVSP